MSTSLPPELLDRFRFRRQQLTESVPTLPGVPYLFLSPFFILFSVFLAFPILYTLYLSFFEFQGVGGQTLLWLDLGFYSFELQSISDLRFVGLENYERLLSDRYFHQALYNTVFIFFVQVPVMVGLALGLALALNAAFMRFKTLFRTAIILPVSANLVAYATVFLIIIQEGGLLDFFFVVAGVEPIAWLQSGFWSRVAVGGMSVWRWTGYNMIILLAGLQSVPQQLYEAAEIDGANRLEKFWYVTLPQLRPVLIFVFVTATIGIFKKFSEPVVLTDGGAPLTETRTIVQYIYETAFVNFNLGYASAQTYVLIALVTGLAIIQTQLGGRKHA